MYWLVPDLPACGVEKLRSSHPRSLPSTGFPVNLIVVRLLLVGSSLCAHILSVDKFPHSRPFLPDVGHTFPVNTVVIDA